jgi:hypothetical protein
MRQIQTAAIQAALAENDVTHSVPHWVGKSCVFCSRLDAESVPSTRHLFCILSSRQWYQTTRAGAHG